MPFTLGQSAGQNMLDYATKVNQHVPLITDTDELPKPTESTRYAFANQYAAAITDYSRWQKILDSTRRPPRRKCRREKDKLFDDIKKQRLILIFQGTVDPQSMADAQAQYDLESPNVQPANGIETRTAASNLSDLAADGEPSSGGCHHKSRQLSNPRADL
jgi:hypothetical protein